MKKIIALVLALCMVFALCACGSKPAAAPAATEAPAAEPVELPDWAAGLSEAGVAKFQEIQAAGKLVMGTSADYPPFEFHTEINGVDTIVGFDVTLGQYIADMLGVELEIVDMSFDNLVISLQKGDFDIVIAAMSATEERKQAVDFSKIYRESGNYVIALAENIDKYNTTDDLAGGVIVGAQKGTIPADEAVKYAGEENVVQLVKIPDMMQEVLAGKIDIAIADDIVCAAYAAERAELECKDIGIISEAEGLSVGIQKGNEGLVEIVDTIIDTISQDVKLQWLGEAQLTAGLEE